METNQLKLFFIHISYVSAGLFWLAIVSIPLLNLQVGIKRSDSKYETVINQINPDIEAHQLITETMDQQKNNSKH